MSLFEPRTPVYGGSGEELKKVEQLLTEHEVPYKLKKQKDTTLVMVKRSLGDKGEMLIREAKSHNWRW